MMCISDIRETPIAGAAVDEALFHEGASNACFSISEVHGENSRAKSRTNAFEIEKT